MQFTPKSNSEIAAMRLKPAGNYAFEVANAEDKISKSSGKEMLVVTLNCYDAEGRVFTVTDFLVPGTPYGDRKIFEFAASVGLGGKYATGAMTAEDCLGKGGWAKIKVGKAQPKKDGSGEYPPKNEVAYYLDKEPKEKAAPAREVPEHIATNTPAPGATDDGGADVPF